MLKVVSIGGFGHSVCVFDEMNAMPQAQLVGLAPAFDGEDISFFVNHPLCQNIKQYSNYQDMLEQVKPDVAIISTRLDLIPKIIICAANKKCNIIAEKPLALNKVDLNNVYQAVRCSNVKLMAMHCMRSQPEFIAAKNIYQSGQIGEAVLVNVRKSYKYGTRPEWFADKDKYGGTIGWVAFHALDLIKHITGLDFRQVAAMKGNFGHSELPACEDNCCLILSLSNGGHSTISVDLLRPQASQTHGDDWIRVVGTKGIIEARGSINTCEVLIDSKKPQKVALPQKQDIFKRFLSELYNNEVVTISQRESFMLTYACLCGQQSAEEDKFINIDTDLFE